MDGVDVSDETVGTTTTDIPASAIQEFQIGQASLDMSTELTSSGSVNVTTKSGTNEFTAKRSANSAIIVRLGSTTGRSESSLSAQPVRRRFRWTDHQEQAVFLRGWRADDSEYANPGPDLRSVPSLLGKFQRSLPRG